MTQLEFNWIFFVDVYYPPESANCLSPALAKLFYHNPEASNVSILSRPVWWMYLPSDDYAQIHIHREQGSHEVREAREILGQKNKTTFMAEFIGKCYKHMLWECIEKYHLDLSYLTGTSNI